MLPPEAAHRYTLNVLSSLPDCRRVLQPEEPRYNIGSLRVASPVGLAAGFDKNAEAPDAWFAAGCGFVEVGTVTPLPQTGNPAPRLFRLVEDRALINRLGFPGDGMHAVRERLERRRYRGGVIGANIGANKDSDDKIADYAAVVRTLSGVVDYFTVNISSPNTPGLRDLQKPEALKTLIGRVLEARAGDNAPLWVKIAPDFTSDNEFIEAAGAAVAAGAQGLVLCNTTVQRGGNLRSKAAGESGGLSGSPLFEKTLQRVSIAAQAALGVPLIAVGGIDSADKALQVRQAGAAAVQLYTGLLYEGPGLIDRINRAWPVA